MNDQIQYEGDWVNDKVKGYGKIIFSENGDYYEGQIDNNIINGKGILYNKKGMVKYEGLWINNEYQGYGNNINENREFTDLKDRK